MMRGASSSPSAPSGVHTRGQKRRIGQSDVWDLIVNNDDICFKTHRSEIGFE